MVFIFLYGPPGVGKLTVAKQLASITGYRIFHNHHTVDLALALFDFGSVAFGEICEEVRIQTITIAAKHDLEGVIFTVCYAHPEDSPFVERVRQVIESNNGKVAFVQLLCEMGELKRRVVSEDRQAFRKLRSAEKLEEIHQRWDLVTPIPNTDTLTIDNTALEPRSVAEQIVKHFEL